MKSYLMISDEKSYTGLVGIYTPRRTYLFLKRAGQVWLARSLPADLPSTMFGVSRTESGHKIQVPGLWKLTKGSRYIPLNKSAIEVGDIYPIFDPSLFALVIERGKLHVRFGDKSHRVKWERSTMQEMQMYKLFQ